MANCRDGINILLMLNFTASMLKPVMPSTKYRKASIFGKDAMFPILQCAGMYSTYRTVPLSRVGIPQAPS